MANLIDKVDAASLRDDIPSFRPGDTLDVNVKVIEGSTERTQLFKGVCIRRSPQPFASHRFLWVRRRALCFQQPPAEPHTGMSARIARI